MAPSFVKSLTCLLQICIAFTLAAPGLSKNYDSFVQDSIAARQAESYDYIVVGSGPGGGPLAANLARSGYSVLVLEAGDDQGENILEELGILSAVASEAEAMRWDFFVKHYSDNAIAIKDPKMTYRLPNGTFYTGQSPPAGSTQLGIYYPRAGTLGGCSTHNGLQTVVPDDADWADIAAITGDDSWNPQTMRGYFQKIENNHYLPNASGHGYSGYFDTNKPQTSLIEKDPVLIAFVKGMITAVKSTYSDWVNSDINNNSPTRDQSNGIFQIPNHVDTLFRRVSSRTRLVNTANATTSTGQKAYPLTIRLNSLVTKVLFDRTPPQAPTAIGVEYLAGKSQYRADPRSGNVTTGVKTQVFANKEVIIAGGAFNTPQILKLSGIGPAAELRKFNIPVVVNLPGVGSNLHDHYEIVVRSQAPAPFTIFSNCSFLAPGDPCMDQWQQGQGPYTFTGFIGSAISTSSVAENKVHDTFLYAAPLAFSGFFPGYSSAGLSINNQWFWSVLKTHARNKVGTVTLKSTDPRDTPEINFRFFADSKLSDADASKDLTAIIEGIKIARSAYDNVPAPYKNITELQPGRSVQTDAQLKEYIRNEVFSHHATSSAAIGADGDLNAVLDSEFNVRGVNGLRVVDASAFPKAPGAFPIVAVFMLSEKASDVILADAKTSRRQRRTVV